MRCYRDGNEGNCRNRILNYRKEENSAGPAILILLDKLKAWVEQIQIVVLGKNTKNLDKSELCTPSASYFEPVLELLHRLMEAYHRESEVGNGN